MLFSISPPSEVSDDGSESEASFVILGHGRKRPPIMKFTQIKKFSKLKCAILKTSM